MAAAEGHTVVVKWLLNHGADVDILDRYMYCRLGTARIFSLCAYCSRGAYK
jgi:hypothetical protein